LSSSAVATGRITDIVGSLPFNHAGVAEDIKLSFRVGMHVTIFLAYLTFESIYC
jgi:hypothetical protein